MAEGNAGSGELQGAEVAIPPLEWTVHPFCERRRFGVIILVVIGAVSVLCALWARGVFWGLFSFAVLFLSLESFYFPTRFVLEERKLTVIRRFSRSEREWGLFRRCYADGGGLTLSPFTRSSWLETYRAIRIRFDRGNREMVTGFVRERLGPAVEWVQDRRWKQENTAA
jgi:hypothetical protein